jgi:hypothetical protein
VEVRRAHPVRQDPLGRRARQGHPDPQGHRECVVRRDRLVRRQDLLVHPAYLAGSAARVAACGAAEIRVAAHSGVEEL